MSKKASFIALVSVIILFSVIAVLLSLVSTDAPELPDEATNDNASCNELRRDIKTLLEDMNYCQEDSDCAYGPGYGCPFGCYSIYNKNADLGCIKKLVENYSKECEVCEYGCLPAPELQCIDKKCVDLKSKGVLKTDLAVDKKEYAKGDTVEISLYNLDNEPVCFQSCNPFYLGKKGITDWDYSILEVMCFANMITDCIGYKETKTFNIPVDLIYSTADFHDSFPAEGLYIVKIPIYLGCARDKNYSFPCGREGTLYSSTFEIK